MRLIIPPIESVSKKHKYEDIIREDYKTTNLALNGKIVSAWPSGILGLSYIKKNFIDPATPVLDSWLHPIEDNHPKVNMQETLFTNGEVSYVSI